MSVYGNDSTFTEGLIANAKLLNKTYPGWQLWVYTINTSVPDPATVPLPVAVINKAQKLGKINH